MATKKKAKKPAAKRSARPHKPAPAAKRAAPKKAAPAKAARKGSTPPTVVPAMRYRDAVKAIEFLCDAFGFAKHLVVPGEGNVVHHAQLTLGNGMIMLSTVQESEFGKHMAQPDETGGRETQCAYVIVPDADAHYARARQRGAEILLDIKTEDYGGRGYTCRDIEGHVWTFGTYDPWNPPKG